MTARMGFYEKANVFPLVTGAWLPSGACPLNRFLVHRILVNLFKRMAERPDDMPPASWDYWLRFFEDPEIVLTPLPFTFEGCYRRRPSKAEFMTGFEEGQKATRTTLRIERRQGSTP